MHFKHGTSDIPRKEAETRNLGATSIYTIKEGHNFSMKVN
jgi:hypothetical protein